MSSTSDMTRYDAVWRAAEPYLRVRKNDIHIPLSFAYAGRLLDAHPQADRDTVLLAVLLHDTGWHSYDLEQILRDGFGPGKMKSDLRVAHEKEGARLARDILSSAGWSPALTDAVVEIIDGHDTRDQARSLEDRLVRDADKLWRYTTTGVAVSCDWFKKTPRQYVGQIEDEMVMIETDVGRRMASEALATARAELMLHLI